MGGRKEGGVRSTLEPLKGYESAWSPALPAYLRALHSAVMLALWHTRSPPAHQPPLPPAAAAASQRRAAPGWWAAGSTFSVSLPRRLTTSLPSALAVCAQRVLFASACRGSVPTPAPPPSPPRPAPPACDAAMCQQGRKRRSECIDPFQGLAFSLIIIVSARPHAWRAACLREQRAGHGAAPSCWQARCWPARAAAAAAGAERCCASTPTRATPRPPQGAIFLGLSASGNYMGSVETMKAAGLYSITIAKARLRPAARANARGPAGAGAAVARLRTPAGPALTCLPCPHPAHPTQRVAPRYTPTPHPTPPPTPVLFVHWDWADRSVDCAGGAPCAVVPQAAHLCQGRRAAVGGTQRVGRLGVPALRAHLVLMCPSRASAALSARPFNRRRRSVFFCSCCAGYRFCACWPPWV